MKTGRRSLFSSPQPGQTTLRKFHSVEHSEQIRERLAPSPTGRSTPTCGLELQNGHSGGLDSVGELVLPAKYSAWGCNRAWVKNAISKGSSWSCSSGCQPPESRSSHSSLLKSASSCAVCASTGEPIRLTTESRPETCGSRLATEWSSTEAREAQTLF